EHLAHTTPAHPHFQLKPAQQCRGTSRSASLTPGPTRVRPTKYHSLAPHVPQAADEARAHLPMPALADGNISVTPPDAKAAGALTAAPPEPLKPHAARHFSRPITDSLRSDSAPSTCCPATTPTPAQSSATPTGRPPAVGIEPATARGFNS